MIVHPAKRLRGSFRPPGDKSISHRALILSSLADGPSVLHGLSEGEDVGRTRSALRALGVPIEAQDDGGWRVEGRGLRLAPSPVPLYCGNSGTTMRLLAGVLAGQPFSSILAGDASLARRPMERIAEPLQAMGAEVSGDAAALTVRGHAPLRSIHHASPRASAQVKSAVLLAGLYAQGRTTVVEPGDSRDHTEVMLSERGVLVRDKSLVGPVDRLEARDTDIPADPSSAAFALCAAAVLPDSEVTAIGLCLSPSRTGFLDVLERLGADVEIKGEDATVRAAPHPRPVVIEGDLTVRCLDEIPALAMTLARLPGVSEIRDAGELRVKESDRLASTAALLRELGVTVDEGEEGLVIRGRPSGAFAPATFRAPHDHRLVMAAAVGALFAEGPSVIQPDEGPATSYPTFWTDLEELVER